LVVPRRRSGGAVKHRSSAGQRDHASATPRPSGYRLPQLARLDSHEFGGLCACRRDNLSMLSTAPRAQRYSRQPAHTGCHPPARGPRNSRQQADSRGLSERARGPPSMPIATAAALALRAASGPAIMVRLWGESGQSEPRAAPCHSANHGRPGWPALAPGRQGQAGKQQQPMPPTGPPGSVKPASGDRCCDCNRGSARR